MKLFRLFSLSLLLIVSALMPTGVLADDFDPMAANIEENIAHPAVSDKASAKVAAAMKQLIRALQNAGYDAEGVRKGEVALVTIPCSDLFAPNSVELLPSAKGKLAPLMPYMKRTDNYKVILAVHADNTGDDLYAERLTADRANAIDEFYYEANGNQDIDLIPYGLGADEPVSPNIGVENRAKNRRVEIYFVPTEVLIDKARKRQDN